LAVISATVPEWTCSPANRFVVPLRTYSLSRRAGFPGLVGLVGARGLARRDRRFSSIGTTIAFFRRIDVQAQITAA
jgi:hypothetical protein